MSIRRAACPVSLTPEQAERRALAWVIGSFLICPCHLPLTLSLAATVVSGTAAGALLRGHPYVAGSLITAAWLAGTLRGVLYFRSAQHS
jgi:Fe2+ transport system protein B